MKNVKLVSAAALFATFVIGGQVALAAPGPVSKDSLSRVELNASDEPTVVNPPDVGPPTGPYVPVGALGITSTTNLLFPKITLNAMVQTVDAQYVDTSKAGFTSMHLPEKGKNPTTAQLDKAFVPGFSVTDKRGTGAGWNLKVKLGDFEKLDEAGNNVLPEDSGEYRKLKGARMNFPVANGITVKEANPTAEEMMKSKAIELSAGKDSASAEIARATKDQGRGIWEFRFDPYAITYKGTTRVKNPVQLTVPADNYVGEYQATMHWTLVDNPEGLEA